jgi:signal transduction histidine kinase/ligand-binding sensor domain-containing protein/CheY-like chemotaxis protein/AraC-like DNA-binding protein
MKNFRLRMMIRSLLVFLLCLLTFSLRAANTHFRTLDVKRGLADNFVRDIMTDSEGYVWISTMNGVSRFDGYRFLNFQPQQWGSRSGDVAMVRETADSTLWLLTISGELFTYRREEQTWQKDGAERLKRMGVKGKHVVSFYVDERGSLWVATEKGLWHQECGKMDGKNGRNGKNGKDGRNGKAEFFALPSAGTQIQHIAARGGTTIVITDDYHIYKVLGNGRMKLLTVHPKPVTGDRDSGAMIDSRMNLWLYHAHEPASTLWVYSLGSGEWQQPKVLEQLGKDAMVNAIVEDSNGRYWFGTSSDGISSLQLPQGRLGGAFSFPHINCLYADRNNTIWAGSAKLGVAFADLNSPEFIHVGNDGREDVSALLEDARGNLWIGFDGGGLMVKGKAFSMTYSAEHGQLPSDNVTALTMDAEGNVLVGTYGGGIAQYDGRGFKPLFTDNDRLRYVKSIAMDRHGELWVATVDKGVVRIGRDKTTSFTSSNSPLGSDGTICLAYDAPSDRMYIGTSIGLAAYDCARGCFIKDSMLDSLRNVDVTTLLVDDGGQLWVGSRSGLWVKGRKLQHLTTEQGLSHNVVRALAMSDGNIWASTDNGLTFISKQDDELKCRPFFDSDGLHDMTFYNNAALTTSDGTVLLGCLTGYVRIPAEVMEATTIQRPIAPMKVRFTEFRINNNPIVMQAKDFTIDYGERLGLSISMMLPALSHKIRYYYRFKGEEEWLRAPTNMLYFASLMPGTHVLQVKAELTGMATSEVSELKFRVRPPLWLSEWAILCYLLLLSAAAWFTWKAVRRRQKRELAMKQMEINLKKYEMEEDKIRFFTNISHDLKTPLTLVVAPLEKIREHNLPEAIRTEIDVAWRNARQLHNLVLELLDFRRLDVGKEKLNLSHGELVSFVRQTAQAFSYYTNRKHIDLKLELPEIAVETQFDENKMRRIITNLLSNAYKYNNDGGSVTVKLDVVEKEAVLSVADTGIGVKDKRRIFDRFVQESHGHEQEGSGLGLHIVQQYVDMMGGKITVGDNQPLGSIFTVTLPITEPDPEVQAEKATDIQEPDIATILIVEDNTDARLFLQRSLEDEYRILLAANGKEALDVLAKNDKVSIIVSDVMMPVMDGMELFRQIRKNIRYSHIPVILLTAKSSEEDIIAGLKEGVADYLTKPYSLAVLRLRIKKILEWTQHIHEQVATGIEIKPSEITVSSLDEELISHVIAEVEANISDPKYSVVQLSAAVGMTRGTLYKKLMAIVGKSPVEFVRIVRIKRGKALLSQGRTNVSEVADKVGFSPKMFAQYFREMYGETPSEYIKRMKNEE